MMLTNSNISITTRVLSFVLLLLPYSLTLSSPDSPPLLHFFPNSKIKASSYLRPPPIHLHRSTSGPPPSSRIKHLRVCLFLNRQQICI
ncbi:hypothetical protein ES288_D10G115600v1 [Gossypium darwinii]|uniref:Uncharacterized protein n=1 Tax=Gossypium darwinii TaxID=34276 RepID=A0A5D2B2H1_GOSDA|nr:hypothetical protein ES288_D10G115600v1 [Gossypium darwinii]